MIRLFGETINAPLDRDEVAHELRGMMEYADREGGVVPERWMLRALGLRRWEDEDGRPCFFRYQAERLLALLEEGGGE